ncbi:MAG: TolC family protein [Prevotellaceae bacterium]|jgi:outer membrane protein TolC|nr:TolC family protein [Prevotellaceae bacterium]
MKRTTLLVLLLLLAGSLPGQEQPNGEWKMENGELAGASQLTLHPSPFTLHPSPFTLHSIEQNNTTLKALREKTGARQIENSTGIFLPGPEVEVNYLWGSPAATGNRTDIAVRQRFDIPTLAGMKARAARQQNSLLDLQYRSDRLAILTEAKQYCNEIIYRNALLKELSIRLEHAQTIAKSYRERLDKGDATILEHNKALLNLATAKGEIARIEMERTALLEELARLNGGIPLSLNDDRYDEQPLPADFEKWFAQLAQQHPALAYAQQQVTLRKQEVTLQKALSLPTLSAGYMSETVVGQQYRGLSVGISLPLWENKNRVKQAKAAVSAAEGEQADHYRQLYGRLLTDYRRAAALKALADDYRRALSALHNAALLKKALDAGEISLLDYMLELGLYYTTVNQALAAERDYHQALVAFLMENVF